VKRVQIETDPDVMSGSPCIEGTRVLAESIIINLRAGNTVERILNAYPSLPPGGIEAAILWAESKGMNWRA
jgi:uncharacterized protein (DUF433 family)